MSDKWSKPCHIYAVRCPHCGKPNDFRDVGFALAEEETSVAETKTRPTVFCDHCDGLMEVTRTQKTTLVWVRPSAGDSDGHQAFAAGQKTYACGTCKAQFFDHLPTTDLNGRPITPGVCPTCGDALSQV